MSMQQPRAPTTAVERRAALKQVEMLSGLADDDLAVLEQQCGWRTYHAGNLIIGQHDTSRDVVFLIAGLARVNVYSVSGKRVSFRDIRPGSVFGELSAIDNRPRSADVEALQDCLLFVMPQRVFSTAITQHPGIARALMLHLTAQVRRLTERVFEFSTLSVRSRVRAELLRLAEHQAKADDIVVLSPAPTHTEIANRISTHREAVTRELNRLEELGVVERRGRALCIPDLEALKRLIEDFET
jgi:CRP-like cAMP-binding protein